MRRAGAPIVACHDYRGFHRGIAIHTVKGAHQVPHPRLPPPARLHRQIINSHRQGRLMLGDQTVHPVIFTERKYEKQQTKKYIQTLKLFN